MKKLKTFIGVDISKATLDICLLEEQAQHFQITNDRKAIRKFIVCFARFVTDRYYTARLQTDPNRVYDVSDNALTPPFMAEDI